MVREARVNPTEPAWNSLELPEIRNSFTEAGLTIQIEKANASQVNIVIGHVTNDYINTSFSLLVFGFYTKYQINAEAGLGLKDVPHEYNCGKSGGVYSQIISDLHLL
jgi:hypothetical protein